MNQLELPEITSNLFKAREKMRLVWILLLVGLNLAAAEFFKPIAIASLLSTKTALKKSVYIRFSNDERPKWNIYRLPNCSSISFLRSPSRSLVLHFLLRLRSTLPQATHPSYIPHSSCKCKIQTLYSQRDWILIRAVPRHYRDTRGRFNVNYLLLGSFCNSEGEDNKNTTNLRI